MVDWKQYSLAQPRLTERVRDVLLEMIEAGELGPDRKLPPEPELARVLGVGRTTLRAALAYLEHKRLIVRHPGVGTFVNPSALRIKTEITEEIGFEQLIRESGHEPGVGWESVSVRELPAKALRLLKLPPPERGLVCERVFLADEQPAIWCVDMVPLSALKPECREGVESLGGSIFAFLRERGEEEADYGITEIVPVNAPPRAAELLGIRVGQAVLFLEEIYFSARGHPLFCSEMYFRDDMIRFRCLRRIST